MKKQNKLGNYLGVTVGAGCAASVAEGAVIVVENPTQLRTASAIGNPIGGSTYTAPFIGNKGGQSNGVVSLDLSPGSDLLGASVTYLLSAGSTYSFNPFVRGLVEALTFVPFGTTTPSDVGEFWVPFFFSNVPDNTSSPLFSRSELSWARVLVSDGPNPSIIVTGLVYDDEGTDVSLAEAVASIPEPSSLVLLALGSAGLVARRQRKAA